jgi:peptide deformylase
MIKKIITYPNPILRKKAATVTAFDDELQALIEAMTQTMFDAPGAGLAANQIGVAKRVCVINVSEKKDDADRKALALINPVISEGEGAATDEEGCLSVIDFTSDVKRFTKIKVTAQNAAGKTVEFEAEDFFARVIQHETDHLEGKLFIDRISSLKRLLYKKKLKKILLEKEAGTDSEND